MRYRIQFQELLGCRDPYLRSHTQPGAQPPRPVQPLRLLLGASQLDLQKQHQRPSSWDLPNQQIETQDWRHNQIDTPQALKSSS